MNGSNGLLLMPIRFKANKLFILLYELSENFAIEKKHNNEVTCCDFYQQVFNNLHTFRRLAFQLANPFKYIIIYSGNILIVFCSTTIYWSDCTVFAMFSRNLLRNRRFTNNTI